MKPVAFAACLLPVAAWAQVPFNIGEVFTLHSAVLGEQRTLNIALPAGYQDNDTARYPVIFLLDGSATEDFIHVAGGLQFASMDWIAWQQPSILVGIANVDRKRDFTFPTTIAKDKEQFPTTGGSAAFIDFIGKELIPFVDAHFRTSPDRLLIGQSLGGLLATEVLFKQPALFRRYLIVSPSLWWDGGSLLKQPPAFISDPPHAPQRVFIAVGKEGKRMVGDARKLRALVQKNPVIRVGFDYLPDFDHANILHRAVMDGFRWLGGK
ncbi:MAG: alpha/beta hydrolase [Bacteroidetes bacterium]|nr:alpha/beta hydrolase [Bacteroidota bacterium]